VPEESEREARDPEVVAEQAYLDGVYERLDAMRRSAERVAEAFSDVRAGGTHQARLERDIAVETTHRRLAALDIGDAPLAFGRIDRRDGDRFYVGRLAVDDEDRTPLVIDWRAPVAEPFYRATPVEPMGVLRRRHLLTRKGREVVGLDDEVFDAAATDAAGLHVVGEGALLAALERNRTGRMGDIVATIQAEQDEAVRADLPGVLIVSGGPGTGKTAVALHRAAYLLYTHRRRLAGNGVLLVGPSSVFLRYIEQVLPSLGEHDVALATAAGLKPQLRVQATDAPAVARVKGDVRMAQVLERALRDRERPPRDDVEVMIDGLRLRLTRRECRRIVDRAHQRRATHNALRPHVERWVLDKLVGLYRSAMARSQRELAPYVEDLDDYDPAVAAALARGEAPPPEWEPELRRRLRRHPDVRGLLERMWPVLTGAELVHELFGFRGLIRSAADGILTPEEQEGLFRPRSAHVRDVAWTEADLALVDEADARLGPAEAARPARRRRVSAEEREVLAAADEVVRELGLGAHTSGADVARRYAGAGTGNPSGNGSGEPRVFGHVLVDEAQDLSPMQWRMVARRAPNGSLTLVGDFGQASKPGAARGWDEVLAQLPTHDAPRHVTLTVNYRTPAEIMDVANRLLAVAAPDVEPTRAVRATGTQPAFVRTDDLVGAASDAARAAVAASGTVAVIAPAPLHERITEALRDVGAVADSPDALDAPVGVLEAGAAKGLEFDRVVVVEPADLVAPDRAGLRLLYVTLTRATQELTVVHSAPLPEALVR
jgi:DNA helicase IV